MQSKHAIVVPVHNNLAGTTELLETLQGQLPNVPLVIVDDASDVTTAAFLAFYTQSRLKDGPQVELLRNERQQLFTRTVNRGLRHAWRVWQPEFVTFLNTDVELSPGWFEALDTIMADEKVGIAGYPDAPAGWQRRKEQLHLPQYVTGHCFMVRTKVFQEIGVFSETDTDGRDSPELASFKGQAHIGSERIFCWKALGKGWKLFYSHAPLCKHGNGKSWGRDLGWLSRFDLQPLWEPNDTLEPERFYDA